jgi:hypothetical protein
MAGFYQQLVEPRPDYKTRLTAAGRVRPRSMRATEAHQYPAGLRPTPSTDTVAYAKTRPADPRRRSR